MRGVSFQSYEQKENQQFKGNGLRWQIGNVNERTTHVDRTAKKTSTGYWDLHLLERRYWGLQMRLKKKRCGSTAVFSNLRPQISDFMAVQLY